MTQVADGFTALRWIGFFASAVVSVMVGTAGAAVAVEGGESKPGRTNPLIDARAAKKALFSKKLAELKALYAKKAYKDAVPLAQDVLRDAEAVYGADSKEAGGSAFNLGRLYLLLRQFDDAIPILERAWAYERRIGSPAAPSYLRVMKDLVKAHRGKGPSRQPGKILAEALEETRTEAPKDFAIQAELWEMMAWDLRNHALFKESEETFATALMIKRKLNGPGSPKLVSIYNAIAGVQRVRGRYGEAETSYKSAIAILRASKDGPSANLAILLDNLAVLYLTMGRPTDAEPVQKEALAIAEQKLGVEHPTVAQILANLATLYENLNRYAEAEGLFLRALAIWEGRIPPSDKRFGITYDNLAGTYREQGKLDLARATYRRALANIVANYPPMHPEVSVALNNLGLAELALKNIDDGRALIEKSMQITAMTLGKQHMSYAVSLGNLGDALRAADDFDGARKAYRQAIEIIEATLGPKHKRAIFPLRELGRVEYAAGNYMKAVALFRRAAAAEVENAKRNPGDQGISHRGVFDWLTNALWKAAKAKQIPAQEGVREALQAVQWTTLSRAGSAITKMSARLGTSDPALAALVRERQDLTEAWEKQDAELLGAVSQPKRERDPKREVELRAKLRIIRDRFKVIDEKIAFGFPAYAELATPQPLGGDDMLAALNSNEIMLFFDVEPNWTNLWVVDPAAEKPFSWRRIRLKRKELRAAVHALRCGLDGAEWVGDVRPLKCLQAVGRMPQGGLLPFDLKPAQTLYRYLLRPFADSLEGRHVIIAANDALSSLPFQVLIKNEKLPDDLSSADWFGLSHAVSVLPTIASLKALRSGAKASRGTQAYLGVGNPLLTGAEGRDRTAWNKSTCDAVRGSQPMASGSGTSTVKVASLETMSAVRAAGQAAVLASDGLARVERVRRLAPLPETADELCAVADTVGSKSSKVLLGKEATETSVKQLDSTGQLSQARVLHFATHGLVAGELKGVGEPALVMSPPDKETLDDDGLLTASEVATLRLDADWVVLSACNTAAGDGLGAEALSGLARSFFYAGARSMLVSHWPVQSDAAVALTTVALREIRRDETVGRAEALRRAIVALVGDRRGANGHPQVWAPFVVVGEGGALKALGGGVRPPIRSAPKVAYDFEPASARGRGAISSVPRETGAVAVPAANGRETVPVRGVASQPTADTIAALTPKDAPPVRTAIDPVTSNDKADTEDGAGIALPIRRPPPPEGWGTASRVRTVNRVRPRRPVQPKPPVAPAAQFGSEFWDQLGN